MPCLPFSFHHSLPLCLSSPLVPSTVVPAVVADCLRKKLEGACLQILYAIVYSAVLPSSPLPPFRPTLTLLPRLPDTLNCYLNMLSSSWLLLPFSFPASIFFLPQLTPPPSLPPHLPSSLVLSYALSLSRSLPLHTLTLSPSFPSHSHSLALFPFTLSLSRPLPLLVSRSGPAHHDQVVHPAGARRCAYW